MLHGISVHAAAQFMIIMRSMLFFAVPQGPPSCHHKNEGFELLNQATKVGSSNASCPAHPIELRNCYSARAHEIDVTIVAPSSRCFPAQLPGALLPRKPQYCTVPDRRSLVVCGAFVGSGAQLDWPATHHAVAKLV